jgi:hypothetical protein
MTENEITKFIEENENCIVLKREYLPGVTKGVLIGYKNKEAVLFLNTIELKWLDNKTQVSCIPEGVYPFYPSIWNKYNKAVLELKDVPNRSEILFHSANYASGKLVQLRGCIAPVTGYADIDGDGIIDGTSSKDAFIKLMAEFGNIEGKLLIYS